MKLYKILTIAEFSYLKQHQFFHGSPDDVRDGFIHLCLHDQWKYVWNNFFVGLDCILIEIDFAKLNTIWFKLESNRPGGVFYPHYYGDLPFSCMISSLNLKTDDNIITVYCQNFNKITEEICCYRINSTCRDMSYEYYIPLWSPQQSKVTFLPKIVRLSTRIKSQLIILFDCDDDWLPLQHDESTQKSDGISSFKSDITLGDTSLDVYIKSECIDKHKKTVLSWLITGTGTENTPQKSVSEQVMERNDELTLNNIDSSKNNNNVYNTHRHVNIENVSNSSVHKNTTTTSYSDIGYHCGMIRCSGIRSPQGNNGNSDVNNDDETDAWNGFWAILESAYSKVISECSPSVMQPINNIDKVTSTTIQRILVIDCGATVTLPPDNIELWGAGSRAGSMILTDMCLRRLVNKSPLRANIQKTPPEAESEVEPEVVTAASLRQSLVSVGHREGGVRVVVSDNDNDNDQKIIWNEAQFSSHPLGAGLPMVQGREGGVTWGSNNALEGRESTDNGAGAASLITTTSQMPRLEVEQLALPDADSQHRISNDRDTKTTNGKEDDLENEKTVRHLQAFAGLMMGDLAAREESQLTICSDNGDDDDEGSVGGSSSKDIYLLTKGGNEWMASLEKKSIKNQIASDIRYLDLELRKHKSKLSLQRRLQDKRKERDRQPADIPASTSCTPFSSSEYPEPLPADPVAMVKEEQKGVQEVEEEVDLNVFSLFPPTPPPGPTDVPPNPFPFSIPIPTPSTGTGTVSDVTEEKRINNNYDNNNNESNASEKHETKDKEREEEDKDKDKGRGEDKDKDKGREEDKDKEREEEDKDKDKGRGEDKDKDKGREEEEVALESLREECNLIAKQLFTSSTYPSEIKERVEVAEDLFELLRVSPALRPTGPSLAMVYDTLCYAITQMN